MPRSVVVRVPVGAEAPTAFLRLLATAFTWIGFVMIGAIISA